MSQSNLILAPVKYAAFNLIYYQKVAYCGGVVTVIGNSCTSGNKTAKASHMVDAVAQSLIAIMYTTGIYCCYWGLEGCLIIAIPQHPPAINTDDGSGSVATTNGSPVTDRTDRGIFALTGANLLINSECNPA